MGKKNFKIIADQSNIDWTGRKITGPHNGVVAIKEGTLVLNEGKLTEGKFVIDTTSIKILDITDPVTNAQLAGHLASEDFFASDKYPEALFIITSAKERENNTYIIHGDLTIKGITHPVAFDAAVDVNSDQLTARGKMVIDRTKYEMKFRSGNFFENLGDTLIYNDFELNVSVTAKTA
jgi:polyisoprenoid-binding protein YceI